MLRIRSTPARHRLGPFRSAVNARPDVTRKALASRPQFLPDRHLVRFVAMGFERAHPAGAAFDDGAGAAGRFAPSLGFGDQTVDDFLDAPGGDQAMNDLSAAGILPDLRHDGGLLTDPEP